MAKKLEEKSLLNEARYFHNYLVQLEGLQDRLIDLKEKGLIDNDEAYDTMMGLINDKIEEKTEGLLIDIGRTLGLKPVE